MNIILSFLIATFSITAFAGVALTKYQVGGENWFEGEKQKPIYADTIVPGRSTVVIFRYDDRSEVQPINIHLNEDFQGSLIKTGGYTVAALCADKNKFAAGNTIDWSEASKSFYLEPSVISYFEVKSLGGKKFSIERVSDADGLRAVQSLPRMTHVISRLKQRKCLN